MDRKEFLKKGLLGTGMFVSTSAFGNLLRNRIDELQQLEVLGFNHLPYTNSSIMENTVLHKAGTRGHAQHGWLDSHHTFSFANYYNPDRMHFGVLRVLNDDHVEAGMGFGRHPHDNMEIISIPLDGELEHKDSMGNTTVIRKGDIQVMSAGTGVQHSEYNKSKNDPVKFLQIWLFPRERNVKPRYDQQTLNPRDRHNRLQQILSPDPSDEGVWIHQDAWFHLGTFDKNMATAYAPKRKNNGVYVFLLRGRMEVNGQPLDPRDGMGVWNTDRISLKALESDTEVLLMDVPMTM